MKAPTYILKRVYLERNQERELQNHEKRLQQIASTKEQTIIEVKKKAQLIQNQQELAKKNHEKAINFKNQERKRDLAVQDMFLLRKLSAIDSQTPIGGAKIPQQQNQSTMSRMIKSVKSTSMGDYSYNSRIVFGNERLHSVGKKREEERINMENMNLANRMMKLPPVISQRKLEQDYQKNKEFGSKILRFHQLKKKSDLPQENDKFKKSMQGESSNDGFDLSNEQLQNEKVSLVLSFTKIELKNIFPVNEEEEKYYLEIKSSVKEARQTTPEIYENFAKSVINETFKVEELLKSKLMYVSLYQEKDNQKNFLGDFEIDLNPYYLEGVEKPITSDLRNYQELNTRPSYMPTDMRKKGSVMFDLKITSKLKQYQQQSTQQTKNESSVMQSEKQNEKNVSSEKENKLSNEQSS